MEIHQGDRAPARSHGTERVGSGISLVDAVYGGITKQAMIWDDTSGHRWAIVAINVLRASLFALLTAVLVQQADRIDSASRAARWIRRPLLADLAVLAGFSSSARSWPAIPHRWKSSPASHSCSCSCLARRSASACSAALTFGCRPYSSRHHWR
jgi:hypothetical protein